MSNIDLTPLIQAVITLIATIITIYILPKLRAYLKEKLTSEQRKKLLEWVSVAVKAAEQLYGTGMGEKKKEYVLEFLNSKGFIFDYDEVITMIESEVYNISNGIITLPDIGVGELVESKADIAVEDIPLEEDAQLDVLNEDTEEELSNGLGGDEDD